MCNATETNSRPDATAQSLIDSIFSGEVSPIYTARGCDYEFECYDDLSTGEAGVVVYCYNSQDRLIWQACTSAAPGDRVIDVVRNARDVKGYYR